jgi:SAM-dependent methyltransferase
MNFVELFWLIIPFSLIALAFVLIFYGLPYGAMYMKIHGRKLDKIIKLGKLTPKKRVYDLGAGFGTIAYAAALSGAKVTAVEIDPVKVFYMKFFRSQGRQFYKIRLWMERHNPVAMSLYSHKFSNHIHSNEVKVVKENLLNVDLHKADVVYCYLFGPLMQKVGEKAQKEMRSGSVLISVEHPIKRWKPSYVDKKDKIYLYRVPNAFAVSV